MSIAPGQKPLIGLGYRFSMWLVCYCDVSLVFWSICTDLEENQEPPVCVTSEILLPHTSCMEVHLFPFPKDQAGKTNKYAVLWHGNCPTVYLSLTVCFAFSVIECPKIMRFRYSGCPKSFIQNYAVPTFCKWRTLIFVYIPIRYFHCAMPNKKWLNLNL